MTGPATLVCPSCRASNNAGSRFCSACATALETTREGPSRETRKLVTILFADVADSTALGERLDPEALRALMGRYFAVMKRIIEAHGGTVEKFIGDAVMAVFGIPIVHEDDALRAVRAAIDIRAALAVLEMELGPSSDSIRFRTGLNSGEVVAGDPTAGQTLVTGDPVNTAARLEQAAEPGEILLGRLTWQLVRDAVDVEPLAPLVAKGKAEPIAAYRLVSVDPAARGHVRHLEAPLVGREREMARLDQAFQATVIERSCQLFTLLGTAGVGKSRLVAEFTAGIATVATILRGRCLSYGEGITYWPIGEIVRMAAGIDEADSAEAARAKVRSLLDGERDADVVALRISSTIGLSLETAPQEEVFWAIRRLLEHLARDRPLVVVIDDVHWAEPTLFDLIEHVADWSRDASILLLCPARPELLDARGGWGGGKLNATTILLEPLDPTATNRLVAMLPGGSALPDDVATRITAAAEGNPLYVEEFLGMLVDDGSLSRGADGAWSAGDNLAEVRVPASISALLSARLERLAPDERAVAERASVVGRVFEQAAVAELATDALRPEVGRHLLSLVRKELVRPERTALSAGDAFKFRHILIRDAAYEALPKAERAILHERFADWLERTVGDRLPEYEEIVGYHLERAYRNRTTLGDTGEHLAELAERAGGHLASAASRAMDRGDLPAAESLLSRATGCYPVGSPMRLALMPDLGFVVYELGRIPEAENLLDAALEEARSGEQPVLAVHIELERAVLSTLAAGEHVEPRRVAEASIPSLQQAGDDAGLARAHLALAMAAWVSGRIAEAVQARERALGHAAKCGDRTVARRVIFWGAEAYGPAPALAEITRLETRLASIGGDPLGRAETLFSLSGLYAMRGLADDARAAYRECRSILLDVGARLRANACNEMGGSVELLLDDPLAAEAWLQAGIDGLEGTSAAVYTSNMLSLQVVALARQGRSDASLRLADYVAREASPEDLLAHITASTGRAIALCAQGDISASLAAAHESVRLVETTDAVIDKADAYLALAEAMAADGDLQGAESAATQARGISAAKQNVVLERRAADFLERLSGLDRVSGADIAG